MARVQHQRRCQHLTTHRSHHSRLWPATTSAAYNTHAHCNQLHVTARYSIAPNTKFWSVSSHFRHSTHTSSLGNASATATHSGCVGDASNSAACVTARMAGTSRVSVWGVGAPAGRVDTTYPVPQYDKSSVHRAAAEPALSYRDSLNSRRIIHLHVRHRGMLEDHLQAQLDKHQHISHAP